MDWSRLFSMYLRTCRWKLMVLIAKLRTIEWTSLLYRKKLPPIRLCLCVYIFRYMKYTYFSFVRVRVYAHIRNSETSWQLTGKLSCPLTRLVPRPLYLSHPGGLATIHVEGIPFSNELPTHVQESPICISGCLILDLGWYYLHHEYCQ